MTESSSVPIPEHEKSDGPRTAAQEHGIAVRTTAGAGYPARSGAGRVAGVSCGNCGDPVGDSRYRDSDRRLCCPCGVLTRMSGKERTDLLRHQLTADLLRRVTLMSTGTGTARKSLEAAFAREPGANTAARFAGVPADVLAFTALRAWAHVPLVAEEIARRGAAFALAEQAGLTEEQWLPVDGQAMVRLALEQDDTLTPAQLAQVADSRFRGALVTRMHELDVTAAARLTSELGGWEAYRLAELCTAPVGSLTVLAQKGPGVAEAVVRDPRATAETLAAIAAHHQDFSWWLSAFAALQHDNVDVTLMPVPLLARSVGSRGRMQGFLDARLGVGTPERTTAAGIGDGFTGILAELLAVVASIHQPAGDCPRLSTTARG